MVVKIKGDSEWTLTQRSDIQRDMSKQRDSCEHRIEESSSRQARSPQEKLALPSPWTWSLSLQNSEKINACLVCLVCRLSLWNSLKINMVNCLY